MTIEKAALDTGEVVAMLEYVADCIIENEPLLSEADRKIGDGDHGLGMKRGMTAAKAKLAGGGFESVESVFNAVGMAMMSSMGGASGAIFGTLFRNGGKALTGKENLDAAGACAFFRGALEGVQTRGKAQPGDKTVVDALAPAAEAAAAHAEKSLGEVLAAAAKAAESGCDASKNMVAKFGRAKSLGDGSLGHPDAGALSFSIIARAMSDHVN